MVELAMGGHKERGRIRALHQVAVVRVVGRHNARSPLLWQLLDKSAARALNLALLFHVRTRIWLYEEPSEAHEHILVSGSGI